MIKINKFLALGLTILISMISLCGCRIGNKEFILKEKSIPRDVLFTLDETECKVEELKLYMANYKNLYGECYGVEVWNKGYDEDKLCNYIKDTSLAEIERIYIMNEMAKKQEITLTDDEKKQISEMAKEYYNSLSDDEISYIGASSGMISTAYEHYYLAEKVYRKMTEGVNEEVSDDEARVMEVEMIFTTNKEKAEAVATKIKGSSDFAAIATGYNEQDSLNVFVARGDYPKEVEEVIFSMDNGEKSDMITTDKGYYFVKVINKFDQEKTKENIETIRIKKQKAQFDDSYEEFVNDATFHLNQTALDDCTITNDEKIKTSTFFSICKKKGEES